ncbi:MAG: hypothetical protein CVU03_06755 [Bacteroidetes bacterium HGW-Bacteroidetes-2]|jgi:uncharacterized membrane protein|nr:MAG: hypothetical protein CVU03_06755 [Bacteroidetes bacterium HGW-Bacteroidetes-2]
MENTSVNDGKTVAIIAYLWLIGWVIALLLHNGNKTTFGAFHVRQSLGIMILGILVWMLNLALAILSISLLGWIFSIAILVLWVLGLLSAIQGDQKPIPVLGMQFQVWFKNIG